MYFNKGNGNNCQNNGRDEQNDEPGSSSEDYAGIKNMCRDLTS